MMSTVVLSVNTMVNDALHEIQLFIKDPNLWHTTEPRRAAHVPKSEAFALGACEAFGWEPRTKHEREALMELGPEAFQTYLGHGFTMKFCRGVITISLYEFAGPDLDFKFLICRKSLAL